MRLMLRPTDTASVEDLGLPYAVTAEAGFALLQIEKFPVGAGLAPEEVTLLLRLPPGFPDATPDMFWVDPPLRTVAGATIRGTESIEQHAGRAWQRWSRHIQGQWRPGIDNLSTYLFYVRRCLHEASGQR
jgi:Prokaryotic E2 family E